MLNKLSDTIPLKTNSKIPTTNNNNTGIVVSEKENKALTVIEFLSLTMINRNKLNENNNYQGNKPTKTSDQPFIFVINVSYSLIICYIIKSNPTVTAKADLQKFKEFLQHKYVLYRVFLHEICLIVNIFV